MPNQTDYLTLVNEQYLFPGAYSDADKHAQLQELRQRMTAAKSYDEWYLAANEFDRYEPHSTTFGTLILNFLCFTSAACHETLKLGGSEDIIMPRIVDSLNL